MKTDTSKNIDQLQREIIYSKTIKARFDMAIEMYEVSRQMAIDSIKKLNPGISELNLKKEVFKRFYQNDFSEKKMQEILSSFK